ncbi:hypothetical protein EHI8A_005640 [Entamoeba histolytica HM-1:IMSS-B]|uniref:Leucine-rich repeat containing protein n=6 Tax=Entamoeba histolytica TaxID=5759 RepID=C4M333_ENTH1|nr:hypothetical protein EHI_025460 [Entamoeba histolytica HM-1:IMSS]EMD46703.1 Hypothetical protein EHI5A_019480 [Entamoeba histolytica KU27]EMH74267.1 hypothetical protein EHI8A_005640 [Entamoeba histolytica HM-1:IMSS-B]EMS13695.1 hypothetical protein KM1_021330 [Entamoeba histolytica HM-3:IMSS]ENY65490.1 hypothetical protein EHI7A_008920 [Entamoeba histolytica HM-1:IMSS-A]GAT95708.1 hypothetical protein CL6EHI_025460 [Entamoeba histolytica]|eukprot:XP_652957.1 hypothetical protein EHI_025460 [Entamoeba histolytica HM-1:IMSS]
MPIEKEFLQVLVEFLDNETRKKMMFINKKIQQVILCDKTFRGTIDEVSKEYSHCSQITKVIMTTEKEYCSSFNCLFLPQLRELEIKSSINESQLYDLLSVVKDIELKRLSIKSISSITFEEPIIDLLSCLTSLTEFECFEPLTFSTQAVSVLEKLEKLTIYCENDISFITNLKYLKNLKVYSSNENVLNSLINNIKFMSLTSIDIHSLPCISQTSSLDELVLHSSLSRLVLPISLEIISSLTSLTPTNKSYFFYIKPSDTLPISITIDKPLSILPCKFFFCFNLPISLGLVHSKLTNEQLLFILKNNILSSPIIQLFIDNSPSLTSSLFTSNTFTSIQRLYLNEQPFLDISSFTTLKGLQLLVLSKTSYPTQLLPLPSVKTLSLQSVNNFTSFTSLSNFPSLTALELFDIPSKCYLDGSLKYFTHINSLIIEPLSYERLSLQHVSSIHDLVLYDQNSKLQPHNFDFYLTYITSLTIQKFLNIKDFSFINNAKSLCSLNITECPLLDPSSLKQLTQITTLTKLKIRQKMIKELTYSINKEYSFISSLSSLQKIQLALPTSYEILCQIFHCKNIVSIDFFSCLCNDKNPVDPLLFVPALTCCHLKKLSFPNEMRVKQCTLWDIIKKEFLLKNIVLNDNY